MYKSLLSFWLKLPCPLCQRIDKEIICGYCQKKLLSYRSNNPQQLWNKDLPVFIWGKYDGEIKRAIAQMKYYNNPEIGILLGEWLAKSWLENPPIKSKLTLIPIPLHFSKLKERGFNQALSIAQGFANLTGHFVEPKGLIRIKETKAMFDLTPTERKKNLKNAFVINPQWHDKIKRSKTKQGFLKNLFLFTSPNTPVLLVDDIYTTGTTIKNASDILQKAGINVVGAIAIASTRIV